MHLYRPKSCPKPKSQTQVHEKKVKDHPVKENSHRPLILQDRTCHSVKKPTHSSHTQYDIQNTQNLSTELILLQIIYCVSFFACKNRIPTLASFFCHRRPLTCIRFSMLELKTYENKLFEPREKYRPRSHTPRAIKTKYGFRFENSKF